MVRAAKFKAPGRPLEIVECEMPTPGPTQVVLKVGRCGICGTDLHMTEPGTALLPAGAIIGHEISGEVVEVGSQVTRLKPGDRVAALPLTGCGQCDACLRGEPKWCEQGMQFLAGGYAQYALAGERECLVLPSGLSFSDGALVEPLAVALHGVRMVENIKDSAVLVMGAGPIGLAVVYWVRRFGAKSIRVIDGNEARCEMAMALGATSNSAPGEAGQEGVVAPDVVFECVGRPGLLQMAAEAVRPKGTVVSLGFCMTPEQFTASAAGRHEVTMKFPVLYSLSDYQMTLDSLEAGHVEPRLMITDTVDLARLPDIFEALRRPGGQCKVMIDPWSQG